MLTVRVDVAALGAPQGTIDQVAEKAQQRFGKLQRQKKQFPHVGFDYTQHSDLGISTSQKTYLKAQHEEVVEKPLKEPLDAEGISTLRSPNGTLQHAMSSRPDGMGHLIVLQEKVGGDAHGTYSAIRDANMLLSALKEDADSCEMHYARLGGIPPKSCPIREYSVYLSHDSAFKNLKSKKSQGAFVIALVRNEPGQVGGKMYILEFASRRSKRLAKSTWSVELHAAVVAAERAGRLVLWLIGIFQGPSSARGLDRLTADVRARDPILEVKAATDCRGLFDSATSPTIGSPLGVSMQVYLLALRECLELGPITHFIWVSTERMLADAMTKAVVDVLWKEFYRTGEWRPHEAVVCAINPDGTRRLGKWPEQYLADTLTQVLWSSNETDDAEMDEMLNRETFKQSLFFALTSGNQVTPSFLVKSQENPVLDENMEVSELD